MNETPGWLDFVPWSCFSILTALQLHAALSSEHDKLRDEIATLRTEVRCFAEQENCDVAGQARVGRGWPRR